MVMGNGPYPIFFSKFPSQAQVLVSDVVDGVGCLTLVL